MHQMVKTHTMTVHEYVNDTLCVTEQWHVLGYNSWNRCKHNQ